MSQHSRRFAHLGPAGTNTEEAAARLDPAAALLPMPSVAAAVAAVERGDADAAVCAIENSLEGSVAETLDQLLRADLELQIAGEVVLPIRHALVAPPGVDPAEAVANARVVYSHPQALAQCRAHLAELAPDAEPVAASSTAAAIAAALDEGQALAVGNRRAAELLGAQLLREDISDAPGNETRFIALAREDHEPTGDDKTSIALTLRHDRPGGLVDVLHPLAVRAINMTRIESRPTRQQLGTYIFLVDVQGHRADALLREALEDIERRTLWLRVFGSYPRWHGEGSPDGERGQSSA